MGSSALTLESSGAAVGIDQTAHTLPRFAAIDVGSNASRLLIVQAKEPNRIRPFRTIRVPVRMGHSVFQTGRLDLEVINKEVEAMRMFAAAMEDARVEDYRAVVTASARGASNADVLLERVREETGIKLDSVDGLEEARLVGMAVRRAMPVNGRAMLMDLGGGSLELTDVTERAGGDFTVSLAIGTVRLLEAFLRNGNAVDKNQDRLLREYIDRLLAPHRRTLRQRPWDHIIGTGGNLVATAKLCPVEGSAVPAIDVAKARALRDELASIPSAERIARYGLKPDRADVLVPALYVILAMADLAKVERIECPGVGLKEGIVTELVQKHYRVWDYDREENNVVAAAIQLGRRYHFDERHGMQVARLAEELFDGTAKLHGMGNEERGMLRLAALLHDIGDFITPHSHHKHTQYIIQNSDLMGLPPEQRHLVALIARYHRRAHPALRHAGYRDLGTEDRDRVKSLAAMLRIADAFDRGHRSKVSALNVKLKSKAVVFEPEAEDDLSLEAWTVERKAELFREVYGVDVRIKAKPGTRLSILPSEPPPGGEDPDIDPG